MLSRIVFTSRRSKVTAIGTLVIIRVILFCAVLFSLSPVKAKMEGEHRTALAQPEPTPIFSDQTPTTAFLPLIAHESINYVVAHEGFPPPLVMASSDHSGHSAISPPTTNSHTFVADEGGYLDGYWERSQLPNGLLTFVITVTAPVVPANGEYIFADGSLTDAGLEYMISRHKLSQFSSLQLHVWDVDDDAPDCPELDGLYVNGYPTGKLRSGNGQWDTWSSTNIPTTHLRFPVEQANGAVQPAINEIAIDVDLLQCEATTWAVEVDWGAISVRPTLNYGIFFVHGWTGNDTTFRHFYDLAVEGGYPTYLPKNYGDGILTITDTVPLLRGEIITATTAYTDVNKVLVVAYSRGGIFTRAALRQYPELASKVAGYITLSTPHHGTDGADDWLSDERIPIVSQ